MLFSQFPKKQPDSKDIKLTTNQLRSSSYLPIELWTSPSARANHWYSTTNEIPLRYKFEIDITHSD